jgi:hypothetical protein
MIALMSLIKRLLRVPVTKRLQYGQRDSMYKSTLTFGGDDCATPPSARPRNKTIKHNINVSAVFAEDYVFERNARSVLRPTVPHRRTVVSQRQKLRQAQHNVLPLPIRSKNNHLYQQHAFISRETFISKTRREVSTDSAPA